MGKFSDIVKTASSGSLKGSEPNLVEAIEGAIATDNITDVKSALKLCCDASPYEAAVIEAFHTKVTASNASLAMVLAAKEALAEYLAVEKDELFKATQVLQPFVNPKSGGMGGSSTPIPDDIVIRATVKLIELQCFAGEFGQTEPLISRCTKYLRYNAEDKELKTRFICAQAQLNESRKRFTEAAQRFYEVSQNDPSQAVEALQRAAICAVLAEPSEARARMLTTIVNDERSPKSLGAPFCSALGKINQMRFLRAQEAAIVKKLVDEVCEAHSSGSPSTLDNSLLIHNVRAVSQVYYNIAISALAALVNVSESEALRVVATMISNGKIHGSINQVDDLITFHTSRNEASNRADEQIAAICSAATNASDAIILAHPTLVVGSPTHSNK